MKDSKNFDQMKTELSWNRKELLVLCERAFHRIITLPHDTVVFSEWVKYNLPPEVEHPSTMENLKYSEDYPITYPVNITMNDEIFSKWNAFLEQDRINIEKERVENEKLAKMQADPNFNKYRNEIEKDGHIMFGDQSFEMLFYLHKHLAETPEEELQKEFDEVNKTVSKEGVTVEEYFEGLNPAVQRLKGYSEGAESFMKKVEVRLREVENPTIPVDQVISLMKEIYDNE